MCTSTVRHIISTSSDTFTHLQCLALRADLLEHTPCFTTDLFRMGAREGSSSSWIFCSRTGLPNCTAFSRVRRKSACCKSMIFSFYGDRDSMHAYMYYFLHKMQVWSVHDSLQKRDRKPILHTCSTHKYITSVQHTLPFSMFLIHLIACPWGSTIRGHLGSKQHVLNKPWPFD